MIWNLLLLAVCVPLLPAAETLSLPDAVAMAMQKHPAIEAVQAEQRAAAHRLQQARSGMLPRVNYSESYQVGNNPVFAFSTLLSQRRFGAADFDIGRLNHPDPTNNFQSQLTVDQAIYDARQTKLNSQSATLRQSMTSEQERHARMQIAAGVVQAYFGVVLAVSGLNVAKDAVKSATASLKRAENVRTAGMSTDADVLTIRVHLAGVREQEIRRTYDLEVARAALAETMGTTPGSEFDLTTPLSEISSPGPALDELQKKAVDGRPELRQAKLAINLAETQSASAKSAMLPQIGARAMIEADRDKFVTGGSGNWFFAATLKWNLFNGNADKERISEAAEGMASARAQSRQVSSTIRLETHRAYANWKGACERIKVAKETTGMSAESLRITKNRYEAGLTTVTDLLQQETANLEAQTRLLAAIYDQRVAAADMELAAGTLTGDSDVLK
jgi:outer membrane protein